MKKGSRWTRIMAKTEAKNLVALPIKNLVALPIKNLDQ